MSASKNSLFVRYDGPDNARHYLIQRGDKMFWDGFDWVKDKDSAKTFHDHKAAQTTVAALMHQRHKGKPSRKFKLNLVVTLTDDNVQNIPASTLVAWLTKALRIDIENTVYGDGPTDTSYVKARADIGTLQETLSAE